MPSSPFDGQVLRAIMSETRDVSCHCWRETEDKLPHSMATAWALSALAQYGQAAIPRERSKRFSIARARVDGGRCFPRRTDERNASTSATAWTAYALHRLLQKNLIPPEQRARVEARGQKGRRNG